MMVEKKYDGPVASNLLVVQDLEAHVGEVVPQICAEITSTNIDILQRQQLCLPVHCNALEMFKSASACLHFKQKSFVLLTDASTDKGILIAMSLAQYLF